MDWIVNLFTNTESVAHIALLYAIVIAIGVYLGKLKIGGISLGVTFVLFAGILAGHVGFTGPKEILTFVQDFGLILFVFMIGLQVGPGFFENFKKGGVCEAINIPSLELKSWEIKDGYLIVKGFEVTEDGSKAEYATKEKIDQLTTDSLCLVVQEANPRLAFLYLNSKVIKERVNAQK